MQRRKLLVGMGSLAAGGAAAVSTGAFSEGEVYRESNAAIVPDGNSPFLNLKSGVDDPGRGPDNAGAYSLDATEQAGDQLTLEFGSGAEVGGDGLPADSRMFFDDVFIIENLGNTTVKVSIDDSDLGNWESRVFFYRGNDPRNPLEIEYGQRGGRPPRPDWIPAADYNSVDGKAGPVDPGGSVNVGVAFDLRNIDSAQTLFSGAEIRVIAANNSDPEGGGYDVP